MTSSAATPRPGPQPERRESGVKGDGPQQPIPPISTDVLDGIIVGRVTPHIYAFRTAAAANSLKVGDTYRPVSTRLREWKKAFPDLTEVFRESAVVVGDRLFRDYSVHQFLETRRGLKRLLPEDLASDVYSREFFRDATKEHLVEAISDIRKSASNNDGQYQFYTTAGLPETFSYVRDQNYPLRPIQARTVERFVQATQKGHTHLLMYAVMRFGKSFTAMHCAAETEARLVVVVSAKADVREEWKRTVETHVRFSTYEFLTKESLDENRSAVTSTLESGRKVVLFLTLQDLQGDQVKERHKDLFDSTIDLLIVDETHYGARAEEYGKVLRSTKLTRKQISSELEDCDLSDAYDQTVKQFDAKVRLHLSGTPYRILMQDEFKDDAIVAFYQFTDIVEAQKRWDEEHLSASDAGESEEQVNEWDNPYYGFPQMVRFAFNPNKSSIAKLEELKKRGVTYAFSELLRPQSIVKVPDGAHKKFVNESEVLALFLAIDGSEHDENLLGLLNHEPIQNGKLCRHIVCVLPFRASCDALEALIKENAARFRHLKNYQIINIAGVDSAGRYPNTIAVKAAIKHCEDQDQKTLTLTVNRMLTGSTVEQWDTMIYLKDTASPQEYDQAIFRLQNQYLKTYRDKQNRTIKVNLKPQTLLVDFDPHRLFQMQVQKSLCYNVNVAQKGNQWLEKRIAEELEISPVIVVNQNRLEKVKPANVIAAVREYSQNKSILDEAGDVPFDAGLLDVGDIRSFIDAIKPIDAKRGLEINAAEGEGNDLDVPPAPTNGPAPEGGDDLPAGDQGDSTGEREENDVALLQKKLAAYYTRILFYAFLTQTEVGSLSRMIESLDEESENSRIARNVGLKKAQLELIHKHSSPLFLNHLDYKIQNINELGRDDTLAPLARAQVAMKKFARVSDAEVVMPPNVAKDLASLVPPERLADPAKVLDIASKQGELAIALYETFGGDYPNLRDRIYSIPTSPLTYEFTRKVFQSLNFPAKNVLGFTSFDLIGDEQKSLLKRLKKIRPSVIVGGPPFQETDGGGRGDSGGAIYPRFFEAAKELKPEIIAMFVKANWYSGGKGVAEFRESMLTDRSLAVLHDHPDPTEYFDSPVTLRGGVCLFLWKKDHDADCRVVNHMNKVTYEKTRPLKIGGIDILVRYNAGIDLLLRVLAKTSSSGWLEVYTRNVFKLDGKKDREVIQDTKPTGRSYKVYLPKGKHGFISKGDLPVGAKRKLIGRWKVLVAKGSPGDDTLPHAIISSPIVSEPGSLCTDSHLLVAVVSDRTEAENLVGYMKTKFFRFMMLLAKSNQNMHRDTFRFVPKQDLRQSWSDTQLRRKYRITAEEQRFIDSVIKDWT